MLNLFYHHRTIFDACDKYKTIMIRIGIDAMGGDFAPEVAIEGAVRALILKNYMENKFI